MGPAAQPALAPSSHDAGATDGEAESAATAGSATGIDTAAEATPGAAQTDTHADAADVAVAAAAPAEAAAADAAAGTADEHGEEVPVVTSRKKRQRVLVSLLILLMLILGAGLGLGLGLKGRKQVSWQGPAQAMIYQQVGSWRLQALQPGESGPYSGSIGLSGCRSNRRGLTACSNSSCLHNSLYGAGLPVQKIVGACQSRRQRAHPQGPCTMLAPTAACPNNERLQEWPVFAASSLLPWTSKCVQRRLHIFAPACRFVSCLQPRQCEWGHQDGCGRSLLMQKPHAMAHVAQVWSGHLLLGKVSCS